VNNIIWQKGDGKLAYFSYADDVDTQALAVSLKADGKVDADWNAVAFNKALPATNQEAWVLVNGEVVIDPALVAQLSPEGVRKAAIDLAIKNDTVVNTLRGMTAAEFDAWWTANVTNAAQALTVLKRLTRIVLMEMQDRPPHVFYQAGKDAR